MNNRLNAAERRHLERVKSLPCGVCGAPPVSEAHHIEQHKQWICIPLCQECHTGRGGIHREKHMWRVYKATELSVLDDTIRKLMEGA